MTRTAITVRNPSFGRLRRGAAALVVAGSGLVTVWLLPALAQQVGTPPDRETIQTIADLVLIEGRCPGITVDYAKLFAFAERHGVEPVDIMPSGSRRKTLDAALMRRTTQTTARELCDDLAADREAGIPGVLVRR